MWAFKGKGLILASVLVLASGAAGATDTDDAQRGRLAVIGKGNCLACHQMPIPEEPDHGDIGPDLSQVGLRLDGAQLAARIRDPKTLNPDTIMPSFVKLDLNRVAKDWQGKTILTEQDLADVVAYLLTRT